MTISSSVVNEKGQPQDYRQPLDPPLPEADATWAEALLQAAGRR